MAKAVVSSIVLDGTNAVFIETGDGILGLEVVPDGTVNITVRLGDGNDTITLQSGAAYSSPAGLTLAKMRLRFFAASATSLSMVEWRAA